MSVEASIDIKFARPLHTELSRIKIIQILLAYGWTLNDYGKISYLPIGDIDDFDWQHEDINQASLMSILKEKDRQNELIGINITWNNTNIGGSLLLRQDGSMSLCLTINRKTFDEQNISIPDVNWYLVRLLPALNQEDFWVEHFTYSEHK